MRFAVCFLGIALMASRLFAQSYNLTGNAEALGSDCYRLTKPIANQIGAIWRTDKLNLNTHVDLEFRANFGNNDDNGADGIVFILQTTSNQALGVIGKSLGFEGFVPSLGVEFDTYQNKELSDPAFDHVAVLSNGSSDHFSAFSIAKPVQASTTNANIEDGKEHLIRIVWEPSTMQLAIYFDCQKRISLVKNIVRDIFGGNPEVFWGFSGTTGYYWNEQSVCLPQQISTTNQYSVCAGQSIPLVGQLAVDNVYSWKPANTLNNPTIRTPVATPLQSTTYVVSYKNSCSVPVTDTVQVLVTKLPVTLGPDTTFCAGQSLTLRVNEPQAQVLWNDNSTGLTRRVSQPGLVWAKIQLNGCVTVDTILVKQKPVFAFDLGNNRVICTGETTRLEKPANAPPGTTFSWSTGSTADFIDVGTAGYVGLESDLNGCKFRDSILVSSIYCPKLELYVPDAFSPDGNGINDDFRPMFSESTVTAYSLTIYSRWGNVLYSTQETQTGWDGRYQGEICAPGLYTYKITYTYLRNNQVEAYEKTGKVLLIR